MSIIKKRIMASSALKVPITPENIEIFLKNLGTMFLTKYSRHIFYANLNFDGPWEEEVMAHILKTLNVQTDYLGDKLQKIYTLIWVYFGTDERFEDFFTADIDFKNPQEISQLDFINMCGRLKHWYHNKLIDLSIFRNPRVGTNLKNMRLICDFTEPKLKVSAAPETAQVMMDVDTPKTDLKSANQPPIAAEISHSLQSQVPSIIMGSVTQNPDVSAKLVDSIRTSDRKTPRRRSHRHFSDKSQEQQVQTQGHSLQEMTHHYYIHDQSQNVPSNKKMRTFLANLYDPESTVAQGGALLSDYEAWKLMKALRKLNTITLEIYQLQKKMNRENFEKTLLYQ